MTEQEVKERMEMRAQIKKLEDALGFYADVRNWKDSRTLAIVDCDLTDKGGDRARKGLGMIENLGLSTKDSDRLKRVAEKNPATWHILRSGGGLVDCIEALANVNESAGEKIIALQSIAPQKLKMRDGSCSVWRCPLDLVPEMDVPDTQ